MKCCDCFSEFNEFNVKAKESRNVKIDGIDAVAFFYSCEDCYEISVVEKEIDRLKSLISRSEERLSRLRLAKLTRMGQAIEGDKQ